MAVTIALQRNWSMVDNAIQGLSDNAENAAVLALLSMVGSESESGKVRAVSSWPRVLGFFADPAGSA